MWHLLLKMFRTKGQFSTKLPLYNSHLLIAHRFLSPEMTFCFRMYRILESPLNRTVDSPRNLQDSRMYTSSNVIRKRGCTYRIRRRSVRGEKRRGDEMRDTRGEDKSCGVPFEGTNGESFSSFRRARTEKIVIESFNPFGVAVSHRYRNKKVL